MVSCSISIILQAIHHVLSRIEKSKEEGSLEPFDPSASYVHPDSRVKLTLKVGPSMKQLQSYTPDSEDELALGDTSPEYTDADDMSVQDDGDDGVPARRSTRTWTAAKTSSKTQMTLQFSPKKTRSRKLILVSEDEQDEVTSARHASSHSLRRSTRTAKRSRHNLDDEDFIDDGDEASPEPRVSKGTKKTSAKKIQRGYGIVHDHPDAFHEEPGVTAHRKKCEKCRREPTQKLLKKMKAGRKRASRRTSDGFEDDEDDYDRIAALGGWVRWQG